MEHIGIDLGSRESQVCVRNGVGEIVEKKRCRTDQLGRYLGKRAPGRVVLETCTEAFRIAGRARQQGHDVRVVAATLVRSLGVGQRGLKNDRRDARALSEASCRIDEVANGGGVQDLGPAIEIDQLRQGHCQVHEKLVDRPPRYWAPACREPAMLGIKNGHQPQLNCAP